MKKTLALLLLLAGLSAGARAEDLVWNGSEGHMTWNTEDTNWSQGGASVKYSEGSNVVFGPNGSGTVTLSETFAPASVTVTSLEDYIFDGTGRLTGEMTLNMKGIGSTLTINTRNDYKGGTLISYGKLVLGDDYALGSGTVTMSNICTLDLGGCTLSNSVTTEQGWIGGIGNGTLDGNLSLGQGSSTTLIGDLSGKGNILMGDNTSLNLGGHKLSNSVTVQGNASISNGTIDNDLTVEEGKTLTLLSDNLKRSGTIYLGDWSTLDLNGKTLDCNVSLERAIITAGRLNGDIVVSSPVTGAALRLGGDLSGSGTIYIKDVWLDLDGHTLSKNVNVQGNSYIYTGTLDASLYVEAGGMLRLYTGDLKGQGTITLGNNAKLLLARYSDSPTFYTLYNKVILEGSASIGCGTINGSISVGANNKLTLLGNTTITEAIKLGDHATLDLGGSALTCDVSLGLNTVIGNGTLNGSLDVAANDSMQLCGDLAGTGAINLGDNATLRLGGFKLDKAVTLAGKATIGDGTLNVDLTVAAGKSLTLLANTSVTGGISLADGAALDLGCNSVTGAVSLSGSATIGNGTVTGALALAADSQIKLLANTTITGGVTLGDNASLDLGKNAISASVTLSGGFATIGNGAINGNLTVAENKSLALLANTTVTGAISLGRNSTLNLGGNTITQDVGVSGSATIGNGSVNGNITFSTGNQKITLCGDLGGTGDISIGVVTHKDPPYYTSTLNLGGHTLTKGLKLIGDTTVSNGKLVLDHDMMMTYLEARRTVTIGYDTTMDMAGHTFMHDLVLKADTAIGNGTIGGKVTVNEGKSVHLFGETKIDSNCEVVDSYAFNGRIELGGTTIQALHRPIIQPLNATQGEQAVSASPQPIIGPVYPGLMKELTVSEKEILGTGRASSLADGLEIQSESDLLIKSMTITADNKISVGQNTITLQDVTIKLSQASYELVSGVYYFNLSDLFHCSVDMTDVTFDASDLSLPEGFNPETNGISFNLGDAKLTAETAERDIYLLLGGYGSRTMSIDEQGRPVFTALVPTPEPTTGTLSLLALAALAARRRRK